MWSRNVNRLYLWQVLISFSLWMPIRIIFLMQRGFSLTEIALLESISWIMQSLMEVPTGVVADTYSRKASLLFGSLFVALGVAITGLSYSLAGQYLAQFFWSLGLSLTSGADEAMLYDSLKEMKAEGEFPKVSGRLTAMAQASQSGAALVGGALATLDLAYPYYATAGLLLLSCLVAVTLKEPPRYTPADRQGYMGTVRALGPLLQKPILLTQMLFSAVLAVTFFILTFTLFQPYSIARGLPVEWLGVAFFALRGVAMGGSWVAHRVPKWTGTHPLITGGTVLIAAALLALSSSPLVVGLLCFAGVGLLNAIVRPVLNDLMNREIPSHIRASAISVRSLLFGLLLGAVQIGVATMVDGGGMDRALLVMGAAFVAVMSTLLVIWRTLLRNRSEIPVGS